MDKKIVYKWIKDNRNYLAKFLSDGIKKASINPIFSGEDKFKTELKYQEFLYEKLKDLGFECELWEPSVDELSIYKNKAGYYEARDFTNRPNLTAILPGSNEKSKSILLTGHADVVEVSENWTIQPFDGIIKEDKVYGRGTIDMKGGIAAMIIAVEAIQATGYRLKGDVKVGIVSDEEAGGMGTLALVHSGIKADACILTEPTDLDIQPLCRGILWGEIYVTGRPGHIELDQKDWESGGAVDAIEKARLILHHIDLLNLDWGKRKQHPLMKIPCQIKVAELHAGDYPTSYAGSAKIVFNAQYLPSEKDENGLGGNVKKEISDLLNRVSMTDSWLRNNKPVINWLIDANCGETDNEHEFVKSAYENALIVNPESKIAGLLCHSDMGFFIEKGIPTINFGPGQSRLAHQDDEFVEIDQLIKTTQIISGTLMDWCDYEKI